MKTKPADTVSVRIPKALWREAQKHKLASGRTIKAIITLALREYLAPSANRCVKCKNPLSGAFYGAGDGRGQEFQCAECWDQRRELEAGR